jgi:hypothetical protein
MYIYLSNRRLKKGTSSSVGDAAKNSSVSPRSGRPLDPGGSIPSSPVRPPFIHLKAKRRSKIAPRVTDRAAK